jgi:hypothetical protein
MVLLLMWLLQRRPMDCVLLLLLLWISPSDHVVTRCHQAIDHLTGKVEHVCGTVECSSRPTTAATTATAMCDDYYRPGASMGWNLSAILFVFVFVRS